MKWNLKKSIHQLRWVGFGEAISWLLLLGIAMPLKYIWGKPEAVKVVGWIHGILFMAYVYLAYVVKIQHRWHNLKLIKAFFAAFIPFGTFFFDKELAKEMD